MLREILNRNLVQVGPSTSLTEAAALMAKHDVGALVVIRDEKPIGIVTDRDIVVRCVAQHREAAKCKVEEVMTASIATCRETDGIFDCIQKMRQSRVRRMPVVDSEDRAVGIISFGDLLAVLSKELGDLTSSTTPSENIAQLGEFAA
jgi:CBS domain-containing protein